MPGVAVVRGKGIPTRIFHQQRLDSRFDFMRRVTEEYGESPQMESRNTLTFEFVWDEE